MTVQYKWINDPSLFDVSSNWQDSAEGKWFSDILFWDTLPETKSLHLKVDAWKTILSFWGPAYF